MDRQRQVVIPNYGDVLRHTQCGVANRIQDASRDPALRAYVRELRASFDTVLTAARASGFHSELWSYTVTGDRALPIRYGTGSDVQLWSTTDLAVDFAMSQLRDAGRATRARP